ELGRLAAVSNERLARRQGSFEQMRRFTADVSHELRTPLTAIRSVGEVALRERRDEASYQATIGSMLEEVDRLSLLVDRLLTVSRAEAGVMKTSVGVIGPHGLARAGGSPLRVLAEEKPQSLPTERSGAGRGVGDRIVLRQALITLVDNAIKYTPQGGRIRIRISDAASGPAVDVIDSGPGVAAEAATRIFH